MNNYTLTQYICNELKRDPGICILTYPYSFAWDKITEDNVKDTWQNHKMENEAFVYVHIPFCKRACHFCGFHKHIGKDHSTIKTYLENLKTEMEIAQPLLENRNILAVTIGGGSPSILDIEDLTDLFDSLFNNLKLDPSCEITLEIYPDITVKEKLKAIKEAGVNRISFGFQSLDDELKKSCNRYDSVKENFDVFHRARDIGFTDISVDLLCGLPDQTMKIWLDSIKKLVEELNPDQICIFPLAVRHPGIPLYNKESLPPFETLKDMYFQARGFLIDSGYCQTTRHNFKKKGHKGLYEYHQSKGTPCLGLGTNSISSLPGFIYKNVTDLNDYTELVKQRKLPVDTGFDLKSHMEDTNAFVIKRLTFLSVDKDEFKNRFKRDFDKTYPEQIDALTASGLALNNTTHFRLTEEGAYYTALVKRCFFSSKMRKLQEERLGKLAPPVRK